MERKSVTEAKVVRKSMSEKARQTQYLNLLVLNTMAEQ